MGLEECVASIEDIAHGGKSLWHHQHANYRLGIVFRPKQQTAVQDEPQLVYLLWLTIVGTDSAHIRRIAVITGDGD